jgi:hypothetical protein
MWQPSLFLREVGVTLLFPKTVVDCFRLRNKIGTEVTVEALQQATRRKGVTPAEILHYAKLCRIGSVILPYLECM